MTYNHAQLESLYQDALRVVFEHDRASPTTIQRFLRIGYNLAFMLIERMQAECVVTDMREEDDIPKRQLLIRDMDAYLTQAQNVTDAKQAFYEAYDAHVASLVSEKTDEEKTNDPS